MKTYKLNQTYKVIKREYTKDKRRRVMKLTKEEEYEVSVPLYFVNNSVQNETTGEYAWSIQMPEAAYRRYVEELDTIFSNTGICLNVEELVKNRNLGNDKVIMQGDYWGKTVTLSKHAIDTVNHGFIITGHIVSTEEELRRKAKSTKPLYVRELIDIVEKDKDDVQHEYKVLELRTE